tara:strand:+ start:10074 stop:10817 length:744 start_codon:yes stop_codon:yes gene_type:complete
MYTVLFVLTSMVFSMTGDELSILMDNRKSPADISSDMNMEITNKKGRKRTLKVKSISKDNSEKQILWFLSPADDKGIAYLKIEHKNKDDEIRLWLPAFKKIRRISAKKKADSFMGSDLSYEDMTSRQIEDYNFTIIKEDNINNQDCYVMKSEPKKGIKSEYSQHLTWVTKDKYLPVKEESYDNENKLLKAKSFKYVNLNSFDLVSEIFVENMQKKTNTLLKLSNLRVNTNVKDNLFQEKNMKRLPRK